MKIILSGYMGSGKSGVGEILAENLGLSFFDLDNEISRKEGRDIPEIFSGSGEIYFRKKESLLLKELLNSEESFVLGLGGGTPCYAGNIELIKESRAGTTMVYLKTSLEELKRRLFKERDSRPLISHLETPEALEDFIRKHLFERAYYYNQSDLIVETDEKSMKEIAEEIMENLK